MVRSTVSAPDTHMRQHDDAVAGQVQVRLKGMCPPCYGALKRGHGVLGKRRLVAPVANIQGQRPPVPGFGCRLRGEDAWERS